MLTKPMRRVRVRNGKCPHCGEQLYKWANKEEKIDWVDAHKLWDYLSPFFRTGSSWHPSTLNGQVLHTNSPNHSVVYKLKFKQHKKIKATTAERLFADVGLPFEVISELLIQD